MTIVTDTSAPEQVNWNSDKPRAVTLTSILIDQALERNRLCANCEGPHWTWQCGEIRQALFAPEPEPAWKDIALGRELCRMKWRNFRAFVALLLSVPADHLIIYAASYQAFIRAYAPDSSLTINQIIQSWTRDMQRSACAEVDMRRSEAA